MITIKNSKIFIDGKETTSAELIGNAIITYTQSHTDLIIFEDGN